MQRLANRRITKGCTRSTHSGGCEVVSLLFVPGEPRRYTDQAESFMHYSLAIVLIVLAACVACGPSSSEMSVDPEFTRQVEIYDRQADIADDQLDQMQRQIDTVDKQQEEMGHQLERSRQLADRFEKLLETWENRTTDEAAE